MYPPKFDYYRAGSVAEALSLKQQHGGKFLAGGRANLLADCEIEWLTLRDLRGK